MLGLGKKEKNPYSELLNDTITLLYPLAEDMYYGKLVKNKRDEEKTEFQIAKEKFGVIKGTVINNANKTKKKLKILEK